MVERDTLPPELLEDDPEQAIAEWAESLDRIDYLTLLQLAPDHEPSDDEVRERWRVFALAFHPDRHRDAPDELRHEVTRIFQRGAEAYRVLLDPNLRKRYLRLRGEGHLRLPHEESAPSLRNVQTSRVQDIVSAVARPFAEKADEHLARGELKQARLQLQLAQLREPNNERLREKMRDVDERIAGRS